MEPGTYSGLKMEDYLAIKALSSGVCHTILSESPLHAKYRQDNQSDSSEASDIGTAFHDAFLEGVDRIVVVDAKDWRTNAAKEQRDTARLAGKVPMLAAKVDQLQDMLETAKRFLEQSELSGIMDNGAPETTLIWEKDGLLCKCRPDWLKADSSLSMSVKTTTGSANPDTWIRTQLPQYDLATAFYELGIRTVCKVEQVRVIHFVVEQSPPYSCSLVGLSPTWQTMAECKLSIALVMWKQCLTSGKYPAYPSRIAWAEPKPWMLAEAEEQAGHEDDISKIWEKE